MCLSNGPIVGFCYWFGYILAQHLVLWSAAEAKSAVALDARVIARMTAMSLVLTVPNLALGLLLNRLFGEAGGGKHCIGIGFIVLVAWFGSALMAVAIEAQKQVRAESGIDVVTRHRGRYILAGTLIGLLSSAAFVFGLI